MTRGVGGQSPANIAMHLKGIRFPVKRQDLIEQAERNGADNEVLQRINAMPEQEYGSMADVMEGYGEASLEAGEQR